MRILKGDIMSYESYSRTLRALVKIEYTVEVVTGLLIRMPVQAQAYRVGGADQYPMVTRRTYVLGGTAREIEVPYIPGSSIKGRMRSLLELSKGLRLYSTDGKIWQHTRNLSAMSTKDFETDIKNRCVIDELFGYPAVNYRQIVDKYYNEYKTQVSEKEARSKAEVKAKELFSKLTITRLLFSDLFPEDTYVNELFDKRGGVISIADFLEEKSENRIDRVTAAADPRDIVRVRPGVKFKGDVTLLIFDIDKDRISDYLSTLAKGFELIELTYLGGSGSRGYGRVKFKNFNMNVIKLPELSPIYSSSFTDVSEFKSKVKETTNAIVNSLFG